MAWHLGRKERLVDIRKSERLNALRPHLFTELAKNAAAVRVRGVDIISLGPGDPDQPTPPHIIEAMGKAIADPANHRYPGVKGMPAFRESVAAWYERRFGVVLDPATEVLALIGSKEANHHIALGLLDPGDLALTPDPGYPTYDASVIMAGGQVAHVPLRADNDFLIDFDAVDPAVARAAKLMWLNYPNNPTTAVATVEFFQRAVEFARRNAILLVSDSPYTEIAFDGVRMPSILEAEGAKDVAVEFNSLSKTYNMAGWRVGMAVGNRAVIEAIAQVKENTDTGIFMAVQYAAIAALDGPQDVVARNVDVYRRRRDLVLETLRGLGLDVRCPQATFYVWSPVPAGMTSVEFSGRLLEHTGVAVTPGSGYGDGGEGYVRLALSLPDDVLAEAMRRIATAGDLLIGPAAGSRVSAAAS
jgi:LL-diaminopimelate aminotransferase